MYFFISPVRFSGAYKIYCPSTCLATKLVPSLYPKMEEPNLLPAPSYSPVKSLLVILLSICLEFCTFLYYYRLGYLSFSSPRGSQPSRNTQSQGAAGKRACRKREKTCSKAMAAVDSSSLLDSDVESIPVPILHPKAVHAAEESQSSDSALLDRQLEHLMIPILEPVRVNNHQTLVFDSHSLTTPRYHIESSHRSSCRTNQLSRRLQNGKGSSLGWSASLGDQRMQRL